MGQRNATYVIVQDGKNEVILPIYNQWNSVKIQSSKMVRGIKAVLSMDWRYNRIETIPLVYFIHAGENGKEWVGGNIETPLFKDGSYTGAFQEDNNNGWNIVKFTMNKEGKLTVSIYCKVGSEDEERAKSDDLRSYFFEYKEESDIAYLEKKCTWQPFLEKEVERLIDNLTYQPKPLVRFAI